MIVQSAQILAQDRSAYEFYVDRLTAGLSRFEPAGSRYRGEPIAESSIGMRRRVLEAIEHARALGFECEGDVTPVVMLLLTVGALMRGTEEFPWVFAVMNSTGSPPHSRIRAIYDLLSPQRRDAYFHA